jgi:RNA polymerase sigma-70 factor, ECF subfamily
MDLDPNGPRRLVGPAQPVAVERFPPERCRPPRVADRLLDEAIAAAKRGDSSSLHFLYLRYSDDLCRYVERFVRDPTEAEDITHNVFAKLMTAIVRYERTSASFSAWIFRIARNAAIDELRKKRHVTYGQVPLPDDPSTDDRDIAQAVRAALEELSDGQRKVLLLRHLVGLTPPEIAELLGKSEASVNGLQHRGRGALRAALKEQEAAPTEAAV